MGLCALGTLLSAGTTGRALYFPSQETGKPPAAQDETRLTPPADFQNALKAAEGLMAATEGAAYEKVFGETTRRWLASDIARCTKASGGTAFGPFTVLVQVGMSGRAEKVLAWPETHIADCLKPKFISADYPKPPGPSWWVKMDIIIEVKEDESSVSDAPVDFQSDVGIVYGGKLGVIVSAPEGWVLDNKSGVSQGVHAVLYPQGSSWRNAPEVMYVNVSEMGPGKTLDAFVAADIARFKKEFSGLHVEELAPIVIRNGTEALVRTYSGGGYANFESVAYAQKGTSAVTYVLTCRNRQGYEKALAPFREMVAGSHLATITFDGKTPKAVIPDVEAPEISGGYSYWSRYKPGTYVAFRYSLKTAQSAQVMLKTIELREVRPDAVVLQFKESPDPPSENSLQNNTKAAGQKNLFFFQEADDGFGSMDLFDGQLSLSPAGILEDPQGERAGEGVEELIWKGTKLPAAWKRIRFGDPGARITVTLWLSDEVPGRVARIVRELEGGSGFREEFMVDDFRVIKAEPAELDRLRAGRKPALVEISAQSYVDARFRFSASLGRVFGDFPGGLAVFSVGANTDWAGLVEKLSPFLEKFGEIKRQQDEDKKIVAGELEQGELAKLRPLTERVDLLAGLYVRWAETIIDVCARNAASPLDPAVYLSSKEEVDRIKTELNQAHQNYLEEYKRIGDTKIRFLKKPRG